MQADSWPVIDHVPEQGQVAEVVGCVPLLAAFIRRARSDMPPAMQATGWSARRTPISTSWVWCGGETAVSRTSTTPGAVVGELVTKRGISSGNGVEKKVQATGVTVTVSGTDERLKNMIKTGHCGEPGDSGGPFFADKAALGMASITGNPPGPANCVTYFQPIEPALDGYSMEVY